MPTSRQIAAAKAVAENVGKCGNIAETEAATFRRMGYSESYAKNGGIKKSRGFREAFDAEISEETLVDVHKRLLKSSAIMERVFQDDTTNEEIRTMFEDSGVHLWTIKDREIHLGPRGKIEMKVKVAFFARPADEALRALDLAYRIRGDIIERAEFISPGGDDEQVWLEQRIAELAAKKRGVAMEDVALDKNTTKKGKGKGNTGVRPKNEKPTSAKSSD